MKKPSAFVRPMNSLLRRFLAGSVAAALLIALAPASRAEDKIWTDAGTTGFPLWINGVAIGAANWSPV